MNLLKSILIGAFTVSVCTAQSTTNNNTVKDADGNVYTTIKIGTQVWTAENLRTTKYNDGSPIPKITNGDDWAALTTPGYCYYNNSTNAGSIKEFGALYNWFAVGTNKLAPKGWHIPSDAEWNTLQNYLTEQQRDKIGKSWEVFTVPRTIENDLSKNNKSGFLAFPGAGGCRSDFGVFYFIGSNYFWWSATEHDASGAYSCYFLFDSIFLSRNSYGKGCGFSVRLLRDN